MTDIPRPALPDLLWTDLDADALLHAEGRVAVAVPGSGKLGPAAKRLDRAMRGSLSRLAASPAWQKGKPGHTATLSWPSGVAAEAVVAVRLDADAPDGEARDAGAALARAAGTGALTVALDAGTGRGRDRSGTQAAELALGLLLRSYDFTRHKRPDPDAIPAAPESEAAVLTDAADRGGAPDARLDGAATHAPDSPTKAGPRKLTIARPGGEPDAWPAARAVAEGAAFARDLVNEPANVLTTTEYARRIESLRAEGVEVDVLGETELERLGMRLLLAVGQGSDSPSHVVVMRWMGGAEGAAPIALVGKGVVFDTGGISIKPSAGMEEMTMDMGGSAAVVGAMLALARRKAKANVVGIVGLVENMPSGRATRPGDIVRSMKGDTVEIQNTDAEGRLVLADILWHVQEAFAPRAIVDLATLTGNIILALGHDVAGLFSNDDGFAGDIIDAGRATGEVVWRMPMGDRWNKKLDTRLADMANIGGREAGAITAAQFLQRFVKPGTPWAHLDIAGTALAKGGEGLSPKGATGWGVRLLDRLVAAKFEG